MRCLEDSDKLPQISVVIPNYNGGAYVREAIDSALSQEGVDVEVIVVDDGSSDESRSIIESYDRMIQSIFQSNKGACAARNAGLEIARGKYVKFLDADDWLLPLTLSREVQAAEKYSASEVPRIVFGDGLEQRDGCESKIRGYAVDEGASLRLVDLVKVTMLTPLPLHRRDCLLKVGGFDVRLPFAEDFDLAVRLHISGVRFVYQQGSGFVYRQHQAPSRVSTRRYTEAEFLERFRALERTLEGCRKFSGGSLDDELANSLAALTWGAGRFALRCGQRKVAYRYFELALTLSQSGIPDPRFSYRFTCRVLGVVGAEWVAGLLRRN